MTTHPCQDWPRLCRLEAYDGHQFDINLSNFAELVTYIHTKHCIHVCRTIEVYNFHGNKHAREHTECQGPAQIADE